MVIGAGVVRQNRKKRVRISAWMPEGHLAWWLARDAMEGAGSGLFCEVTDTSLTHFKQKGLGGLYVIPLVPNQSGRSECGGVFLNRPTFQVGRAVDGTTVHFTTPSAMPMTSFCD